MAQISDQKSGQSALESLGQIAATRRPVCELLMDSALGPVLEATGDKSACVKDAAGIVFRSIAEIMSLFVVEAVLPALLSQPQSGYSSIDPPLGTLLSL